MIQFLCVTFYIDFVKLLKSFSVVESTRCVNCKTEVNRIFCLMIPGKLLFRASLVFLGRTVVCRCNICDACHAC